MRDLEDAVQLKSMLIGLLSNCTSFLTLLSCQMFSYFELLDKVCEDFRPVLKSFAKPPLVLEPNDFDIRTEWNQEHYMTREGLCGLF